MSSMSSRTPPQRHLHRSPGAPAPIFSFPLSWPAAPGGRIHVRGADDILVLGIDEDAIDAPVPYEDEDEPFPHIHGELPLDAVRSTHELPRGADGFRLPSALRDG